MGVGSRIRVRAASFRHQLGEFWWYTVLMFGVQLAGMFVNFYTGLWLIPCFVSQADLGAILPLTQLAAFLAMPLGLLMVPFGKYLSTFMVRGEAGKAKALLVDVCLISVVAAVIMTIYTVAVAPFVLLRMRVSGLGIVALLCVMAFLNGLKPAIANSTQALKRFDMMLFSGSVAPPLRFALVWILAGAYGLSGALGAQCGIDLFLLFMGAYSLHLLLGPQVARLSYRAQWGEMLAFSVPVMITTMVLVLAATVEPFVIRHRLPEIESAAYYVVTRFSEFCGFAGGVIGVFFFPLVSERFERGESTTRLLWHANVVNVLFGGLMVVFLIVCGGWILGLRPQWAVYQGFAGQMWRLGLIQVMNGPIAVYLTHEIACRRFGFAWFCTAVRLLMAILLYGVTGWVFFQPYLPAAWWQAVNDLAPCHLSFVVNLSLFAQVVLVFSVMVIVARDRMQMRKGGLSSRLTSQ